MKTSLFNFQKKKPFKIFHVPKTGGTTLKSSLIDDYKVHKGKDLDTMIDNLYIANHHQRLNKKAYYIIFLRDPIERFISHFIFHKKHGQGYDTDKYFRPNTPSFVREHDINSFIPNIHKYKLNQGNMHVNFNFAFKGLNNVKRCEDYIFFVGRMEHLEEDFYRMQDKLGIDNYFKLNKSYSNKRPKKYDNLTSLTDENKKILREYLSKDYEIIKYLVDEGFVDSSYLKEINY